MNEPTEKAPFTVVQQLSPDQVEIYATAAASVEPPVEFAAFDVTADEGAEAAREAIIARDKREAENPTNQFNSAEGPIIRITPDQIIQHARDNGRMIMKLVRPEGATSLSYFWNKLRELRAPQQP